MLTGIGRNVDGLVICGVQTPQPIIYTTTLYTLMAYSYIYDVIHQVVR